MARPRPNAVGLRHRVSRLLTILVFFKPILFLLFLSPLPASRSALGRWGRRAERPRDWAPANHPRQTLSRYNTTAVGRLQFRDGQPRWTPLPAQLRAGAEEVGEGGGLARAHPSAPAGNAAVLGRRASSDHTLVGTRGALRPRGFPPVPPAACEWLCRWRRRRRVAGPLGAVFWTHDVSVSHGCCHAGTRLGRAVGTCHSNLRAHCAVVADAMAARMDGLGEGDAAGGTQSVGGFAPAAWSLEGARSSWRRWVPAPPPLPS